MFNLFLGPLVFAAMLRLTTPVLLVSMGGSFGHKGNILNIGLESFIAISAFFAMWGSYLSENPWVGLLFGVLSSVAASAVFAVFVLYFKSNAIVVGISMNLAAWGITTFLLSLHFRVRGVFISPRIKSFRPVDIFFLRDIPWFGAVFNRHNILVCLAFVSVAVSWVLMYKTPFGLRLRGVGIKEAAARTVGVDSSRYKWIAVLLGGFFSGIAGSFLTIGGASMFTENMSAGRGFLALAAIMVGDGNPVRVMLASLVFGYTSALSVTLQSIGIPSQIVMCFPYAITVLILFFSTLVKRSRAVRVTDRGPAQSH
jgi:simple sugar transport system permease protein